MSRGVLCCRLQSMPAGHRATLQEQNVPPALTTGEEEHDGTSHFGVVCVSNPCCSWLRGV